MGKELRFPQTTSLDGEAQRAGHRRASWLVGAVILVGLLVASQTSYLLFHTLAEVIGAAIAGGIFMFAWSSRPLQSNDFFLFLGAGYLFVGLLDIVHAVAYRGMGVLPDGGTNPATQLWIASRALESLTLLASFAFLRRRVREPLLIAAFAGAAALAVLSIFAWDVFPDCFVEGVGLTAFKKGAEYAISGVLAAAAVGLRVHRALYAPRVYRLLGAAILVTIASELTFTAYLSAYDLANLLGHVLKLGSFALVYAAIIHTGLIDPSKLLFHELKQNEAALLRSHAHLEECVRQRTSELGEANRRLRDEIAEQRRTARELRESEERYSSLFMGTNATMLVLDPATGRIVSANPAACAFYGYEDLEGRRLAELQTLTEPQIAQRMQSVERGDVSHFFGVHCLADGTTRDVEIYAGPIRVGSRVLLFAIVHDVSRRVEAEAEAQTLQRQLRQATKMEAIGTLAGGIAHDFNNILTPILGYTEMVRNGLPEGAEDRRRLDEVLRAGQRARELVRQILTFSRRSEPTREPVSLAAVVDETLRLVRATLPTTIEIRRDIDPRCRPVRGDSGQLQQVLMNLCTNAFHAMRATGGVLAISLRECEVADGSRLATLDLAAGTYAQIEVSDTGTGMNREVLERIFEPYFTTRAKGEGTGLGLSIVHGIVRSHGGQITAYSEPGRGTSFHVYLPCIEEAAGADPTEGPHGALPRGTEQVLVVDDEQPIVEMMQVMLESLGYRVTPAPDPGRALELFRTAPQDVDLVLTDMTMPGMTGVELAGELLQLRPDLRIVLCSGFSELINGEQSRDLGIRAFLMKPVLVRDVARTLRRVLDEP